ncbi:hypothetical protein LQ327_09155 [Actinomycetospora endophytica]|uniref:Uncharacterized protein n=1 Tax=Actinomycetospora endophytica TaxID=2291215 RepID=A0ABS8P7N8_9PSEU|nr:hypothetical protein [Actinomycetospora endophytica]MCD2193550.1 hypothetical protein [Actinomycetospora endophytica]
MGIRLYGFVGPVGVSVPVGRRRAKAPRVKLVDTLTAMPWAEPFMWLAFLGMATISAVLLPFTLLGTVPWAVYLVLVRQRAARARKQARYGREHPALPPFDAEAAARHNEAWGLDARPFRATALEPVTAPITCPVTVPVRSGRHAR